MTWRQKSWLARTRKLANKDAKCELGSASSSRKTFGRKTFCRRNVRSTLSFGRRSIGRRVCVATSVVQTVFDEKSSSQAKIFQLFCQKRKKNNFIGSEKCHNSSLTLRCRYNFKPEVNNKLERSRSFFYFVLYFYIMLGACTCFKVLNREH
jgi:hypothetical protein